LASVYLRVIRPGAIEVEDVDAVPTGAASVAQQELERQRDAGTVAAGDVVTAHPAERSLALRVVDQHVLGVEPHGAERAGELGLEGFADRGAAAIVIGLPSETTVVSAVIAPSVIAVVVTSQPGWSWSITSGAVGGGLESMPGALGALGSDARRARRAHRRRGHSRLHTPTS
jgi:hypothetical protein